MNPITGFESTFFGRIGGYLRQTQIVVGFSGSSPSMQVIRSICSPHCCNTSRCFSEARTTKRWGASPM